MATYDTHGAELFDGDTVFVIKDLKVGGSSLVLKRGEGIKNIRLVEPDEEGADSEVVECRIGKATLVLKACFLKKKV